METARRDLYITIRQDAWIQNKDIGLNPATKDALKQPSTDTNTNMNNSSLTTKLNTSLHNTKLGRIGKTLGFHIANMALQYLCCGLSSSGCYKIKNRSTTIRQMMKNLFTMLSIPKYDKTDYAEDN